MASAVLKRGVSFEHEDLLRVSVSDTNCSTWSMMGSNEFTGCVKPYTTFASSASNVPDGKRKKKREQPIIKFKSIHIFATLSK